jgi:DDE family transposase
MVPSVSLLVTLVQLVDRLPAPPPPTRRARGRPSFYPDRLFLKALVIMIVRHLHRVHELLAVLEQPTPEMQALRALLTVNGRYPTRRTWDRRLQALPATLPAQIGCFGRYLVSLLQPWANGGRAAALDSTVLRARGGVWHKKDREKGEIPHTSIDTQAHWTKSGWHGWVYGWKLHVATTVAAVWIPLAAELTAANVADNEVAPALIQHLPPEARMVLGDLHYNAPNVQTACVASERILVTPQYGPYPHTDDGVEVRRFFHELRSRAIENFNEQFKGIFDGHGQVPTKGLRPTQRFALGAILAYQLTLLYRFEHHLDLRVGLKPFLKAA